MAQGDFFDLYSQYTSDTEVPPWFHRWSAIAGIGAFLGRRYSFLHGHFIINPNIYCMLIGNPGTRKSTAIKQMKALLQAADYTTIAADKTTKEKFIQDLAGYDPDSETPNQSGPNKIDLATLNIFGDCVDETTDREMLIAADEFNDFFGNGNIEFISLLGTLWDYNGTYRNRIKNGKSVSIYNPTVSILGGNTPTGFSLAFPPEILGQGFFSRLLLVYGEPTDLKIPFPRAPDPQVTASLVEFLTAMRTEVTGAAIITPTAQKLLEKIYCNYKGIEDVRFDSYSNRRFTHLLKLCLVVSAARLSKIIEECDVVYANTILTHTEHLMPKALGEFGKSKHADVVHKIMTVLESATLPMQIKELWKHVVQDLEKITDLAELLRNLNMADKIVTVQGGFLSKRKKLVEVSDDVLDYGLLTAKELGK